MMQDNLDALPDSLKLPVSILAEAAFGSGQTISHVSLILHAGPATSLVTVSRDKSAFVKLSDQAGLARDYLEAAAVIGDRLRDNIGGLEHALTTARDSLRDFYSAPRTAAVGQEAPQPGNPPEGGSLPGGPTEPPC